MLHSAQQHGELWRNGVRGATSHMAQLRAALVCNGSKTKYRLQHVSTLFWSCSSLSTQFLYTVAVVSDWGQINTKWFEREFSLMPRDSFTSTPTLPFYLRVRDCFMFILRVRRANFSSLQHCTGNKDSSAMLALPGLNKTLVFKRSPNIFALTCYADRDRSGCFLGHEKAVARCLRTLSVLR